MYICTTPYCYGDCEECLANEKYEKEQEELNAECPHRKECKWITINVKMDRCTTCNKNFKYP